MSKIKGSGGKRPSIDGSQSFHDLRRDLQECRDELPRLKVLHRDIEQQLLKTSNQGDLRPLRIQLEKYHDHLTKDIDNYAHMLVEANDLEKSWNEILGQILSYK